MEQSKSLFTTRTSLIKAAILLLFFAISDAIFTDIGILYDHIEEANPLMRFVYDTSISSFYLYKIVLPVMLLYLILKIKPKPYFTLLIVTTLLLYFFVFCMHIFWITVVNSIIT